MDDSSKLTVPTKEQIASIRKAQNKVTKAEPPKVKTLMDNFPNHDIVDVKRGAYPVPELNATVVLGGGLLYQVVKATKKGGVLLKPMLKKLTARES